MHFRLEVRSLYLIDYQSAIPEGLNEFKKVSTLIAFFTHNPGFYWSSQKRSTRAFHHWLSHGVWMELLLFTEKKKRLAFKNESNIRTIDNSDIRFLSNQSAQHTHWPSSTVYGIFGWNAAGAWRVISDVGGRAICGLCETAGFRLVVFVVLLPPTHSNGPAGKNQKKSVVCFNICMRYK